MELAVLIIFPIKYPGKKLLIQKIENRLGVKLAHKSRVSEMPQ